MLLSLVGCVGGGFFGWLAVVIVDWVCVCCGVGAVLCVFGAVICVGGGLILIPFGRGGGSGVASG